MAFVSGQDRTGQVLEHPTKRLELLTVPLESIVSISAVSANVKHDKYFH